VVEEGVAAAARRVDLGAVELLEAVALPDLLERLLDEVPHVVTPEETARSDVPAHVHVDEVVEPDAEAVRVRGEPEREAVVVDAPERHASLRGAMTRLGDHAALLVEGGTLEVRPPADVETDEVDRVEPRLGREVD